MKEYALMFKALGNRTRLRIFLMLRVKPLCVCEIGAIIPFKMSTLSSHLKQLKDAGLINSYKDSRFINHQLNRANIFVANILEFFAGVEDREIEEDSRLAEEVNRFEICGKQS